MPRPELTLTTSTWWLVGVTLAALCYAPTAVPQALQPGLVWALACTLLWVCGDPTLRLSALRLHASIGLFIVAVRVGFRVLFSGGGFSGARSSDNSALRLPLIDIALGPFHFSLLGPVPWAVIEASAIDGLRLAAVVMAFGMANTVANPRRLLRYAPGALYELSLALSIALNLGPQLVVAAASSRKALAIRGERTGIGALPKLLMPVFEQALESTMAMAASMDARGFGIGTAGARTGLAGRAKLSSAATWLALTAFAGSAYLLLATASPPWIPFGLLLLGLLGLWLVVAKGSSAPRTRLPVEIALITDWLVRAICAIAIIYAILAATLAVAA